ncbi:MAG TPA: solute carrier family 23 protein [Syntrophorhabdaceae bacterium]|nr:solute carrier family 23 protein [Syntrophorhabdaceae bacterium]
MAKKPANLLYDVDDRPPAGVCVVLAIQHIFFLTGGFIVVAIVMGQMGCSPELIRNVVSITMIAGGMATILQALNRGPVGSGYLCTEGTDPSFLSISILAGSVGGLPLIFGMTIVSGVIECLLSRVMHRLRVIFPPDVAGVVLTMVGLNIVPIMILDFMGVKDRVSPVETANVLVASITLAIMVGMSVWGKGKLRLYSVIVGIAGGYAASILLGVLTVAQMREVIDAPVVSVPDFSHVSYSFDPALIIPMVIVTLASTLKSVASLTMCQKVNDTAWVRPDLVNIGKGTLADGLASIIGGGLGALGKSLYAASVGLTVATGATSRIIAWYIGFIFIALAFLPKLAAVFSIMPKPVMGGAMVYMVAFMVISGIQMMTSRMIDNRKTFVIAVSLMFGMSVDIFPDLYRHAPAWLEPFLSSSLTVTTVLAIVLNLIMRIGISRRATLKVTSGEHSSDIVFRFMEDLGASWGARKEVVYRAVAAMNEFAEAIVHCGMDGRQVLMTAVFDELSLDIRITYEGPPVEFPEERPDMAAIIDDPEALARMSGFLVRHFTDRIRMSREGERTRVDLHFDH